MVPEDEGALAFGFAKDFDRVFIQDANKLLVEDSIVRSTTLKILLKRIYQVGKPKEIHVRVACPPIIRPCFYGIDMSTIGELFANRFVGSGVLTRTEETQMAEELKCDSLRYLGIPALAEAIDLPETDLCQACVTGDYPTPGGQRMYQIALGNQNKHAKRSFDANGAAQPRAGSSSGASVT